MKGILNSWGVCIVVEMVDEIEIAGKWKFIVSKVE